MYNHFRNRRVALFLADLDRRVDLALRGHGESAEMASSADRWCDRGVVEGWEVEPAGVMRPGR